MGTMASEMVERVAAAINRAGIEWLEAQDPKRMSLGWADVPDEVFARAAIEAMREPTEAMVEAAWDEAALPCCPQDIWPKMIAAALADEERA
jgi:hypothetical protein